MQQQSSQDARLEQPQGAPGGAFLQQRWRRAAQVPASERSPDVAAFVEAYQLMQQAHAVLPIDQNGQATLPDTPATQQQVLRAMVRVAKAAGMIPGQTFTLVGSMQHEQAYYFRLVGWAGNSSLLSSNSPSGDMALLAEALACCWSAWPLHSLMSNTLNPAAAVDSLAMFSRTAERLSQPSAKAAVQRALEQLAAAEGQQLPLMTAEQLQYACCKALVDSVRTVATMRVSEIKKSGTTTAGASGDQFFFDPRQQAALFAISSSATALMSQLQPTNPEAWAEAAKVGNAGHASTRSLELCGRALELAGQQGSLFVRMAAAARALFCFAQLYNDNPAPAAAVATARLALATLDSLPAELERSRRLLPEMWVQILEGGIQSMHRRAPAVRAILSGKPLATKPAVWGPQDCVTDDAVKCAGCGDIAVGLRVCSRCRRVKYCSRECQAAHWRQHKRECRP